MNVNDKLEALIEGMDKDGKGFFHHEKTIVFVEGALEGELCEVEIINIISNCAFAKLLKLLKASPERINPLCPNYDLCGGCDMQHMTYELEAKIKENKVRNTLKFVGKLSDPLVRPIIKASETYHYRNKAIIPFGYRDNKVVCGMYMKKSHEIIDFTKCLIEPSILTDILEITKKYLTVNKITIYDELKHKGLFRAVMVRVTKLNEIMLVFVVTKKIDLNPLVKEILNKANLTSVYLCINDKKTNVVLTNNNVLIYGKETIMEEILGHKFEVSPNTFLQINHAQTEKLYQKAIEYLNPQKEDNIIDAYCGMGSITLSIAPYVNSIHGIEIVPEAILNARINALNNNITNATFTCGKCEEEIINVINQKPISAMVFDPPRKGCEKSFLDTVKKAGIKRIVYISCNIATCARDILYLSDKYKVVEATPVDLFPRSLHVETVVLLERK